MSIERKALLIILGIAVFCIVYFQYSICDCKKRISYENIDRNSDIDLDDLYQSVGFELKDEIRSQWKSINLSSDSFKWVSTRSASNTRTLKVVRLMFDGEKHYGAIIFPKDYDVTKVYPSILWANGLNQNDPSVYVDHKIIQNLSSELEDHFILIPSFRGQALVVQGKRYCSDGFFGDAFDGATDDALRLISFVKEEIQGIDEHNISAIGVSRGGTVALLMGARDSSIKNVVSISAPTNFYSKDTYFRYGKQYKYQFLSKTQSIEEIRTKILKSSPAYFIEDYSNPILLIHGKNDHIVSVSHANKVIEKMEGRDGFGFEINNGGHDFNEWGKVIGWIRSY